MEPTNRFLKIAAVVPAIVVVGAFIGCRTGAFERFTKPEPHPLGFNVPDPQQNPNPPASESKPVFMSGPKSTFIFAGSTVKAPNAPPAPVTPNE